MAMIQYYTEEEIHNEDAGSVTMGQDELRYLLAIVLTNVPADIVDMTFENCLFVALNPKTWGEFLPNDFIGDKGIIVFPWEIFDWPLEKQTDVILHEIAHFVLGHKAGFDVGGSAVKKRQEAEADKLRDKWLSEKKEVI